MPEADAAARNDIIAKTIGAMPFAKALDMRVDHVGDGAAEMTMPYSPDAVGDPETGVLHGGAVSALLDSCAGAAVLCHPDVTVATATLNLRIDYMRPARPDHAIRAKATCYHVTRSVAFVRATATEGNSDRVVATAAGAFTLQQTAMG
ncbi:MAG: PaaI family thioesterase [Pseudomonadota bacterium]